jgi:hypothetical protein
MKQSWREHLVIANSLGFGGATRSHSRNMAHFVRQLLFLIFIGATPALLATTSAEAGGCDNQTVSTSDKAEQLSSAVLINEHHATPYGERHAGSVCWSLEWLKTAGQRDRLVVHADVDIPDIDMKMAMDISQNAEGSSATSHFVVMTFEQPKDAAGGEVVSVPGLMLKNSERAKGTPLAAQATKIAKGSFLVGLSNRESDRSRNMQLLKERPGSIFRCSTPVSAAASSPSTKVIAAGKSSMRPSLNGNA